MSFSFYCVEPSYCDYLREYDPKVPYTMDKKSTRPFIGIVLNINGFDYFAPLTSPKPKHLKMKNQIDFLKINNGIWGAINFNNMIPVPQCCLSRISMEILPTDTQDEIAYKNLLMNQLSWCNVIEIGSRRLHTRECRIFVPIIARWNTKSQAYRFHRERGLGFSFCSMCQNLEKTMTAGHVPDSPLQPEPICT